jgi:hypothetical protein
VCSMVVHGHEWNNNLPLPEIYCRLGIAPAIPRLGAPVQYNPQSLISYIDSVISRHPDTRVWNLSWNERVAADPVYVSALGHNLSILARKHRVLLVISAGNASNTDGARIAPPADCEAALVVGARQFDLTGTPTSPSPESLPGYGPELQLVPQVATYSPLRLLGGVISHGTSFPNGLVSSLAANTFANLREPTPDKVRALIVNSADLYEYDPRMGWGTPRPNCMPWHCAPGSVTFVFHSNLKPGVQYYWDGIRIPPELVRDGKLYGRVSLTTVHEPLCNANGGPSYIASRVAASIQYPNAKGEFVRLLGSKEFEDTPEVRARLEEYKWQPLRREYRDFTQRGGIGFEGESFRIYARAYARDIGQFGYKSNAAIPAIETVFVVSFYDDSTTTKLYDSVVAHLGNYVESAVLHQDIEIDGG